MSDGEARAQASEGEDAGLACVRVWCGATCCSLCQNQKPAARLLRRDRMKQSTLARSAPANCEQYRSASGRATARGGECKCALSAPVLDVVTPEA
jgi:hypothetical protein